MEFKGTKVYFTVLEQMASGLTSPRPLATADVKPAMATKAKEIEACNAICARDETELTFADRGVAQQLLIDATKDMELLRRMDLELNPTSLQDLYDQHTLGDNATLD